MKRKPLLLIVPALIAALALMLAPTQQPVVADGHGGEGHEVLHEAMEVLQDEFRMVRRQMGNADMNADTADRLALMIDASIAAKSVLPETATTDDLRNSYRVIMNRLIVELAQAENAALEGDNTALRAHITAANGVKGDGHEMFIADDE